MRLSLVQLHYLVAIVEHGGITAASRAVHISQSAISASVAQLEEVLGAPIFERNRKEGLRLTGFGSQVVERARAILQQTDDLLSLGRTVPAKLEGSCRLGCYWYLAPICMAPLTRRWQQLHPACELVPFFAGFGEVAEALWQGRVDVALSYNIGLEGATEVTFLKELRPNALLPSGHPLTSLQVVSLAELASYPVVVVEDAIGKEQILSIFTRAGVAVGKIIYSNSFEMMCSLVGNGMGVGIVYLLPALTTSYDGRRLLTRPISDSRDSLRVAVYARPGEEKLPHVAAVARLTSDLLAEAVAI